MLGILGGNPDGYGCFVQDSGCDLGCLWFVGALEIQEDMSAGKGGRRLQQSAGDLLRINMLPLGRESGRPLIPLPEEEKWQAI